MEHIFPRHKISLGKSKSWAGEREYRQSLRLAQRAFGQLKVDAREEAFPFLEYPFLESDLVKPQEKSLHFQSACKNVLVLGSGGDTLGARAILQALCQKLFGQDTIYPKVHFMTPLDTERFWETLAGCTLKGTAVLVYSETGEDLDALLQLMRYLEYWKAYDAVLPSENFLIVSPKGSSLEAIAQENRLPFWDYPRGGQAFNCFSPLGIMPGMVMGVSGSKLRKGAAYACHQFFSGNYTLPLEGAALLHTCYQQDPCQWVLPYSTCLEDYGHWLCYLFNRSFGKEKGLRFVYKDGGGYNLCDGFFQSLGEEAGGLLTQILPMKVSQEKLSPRMWKAFPQLSGLAYVSIHDLVKARFHAAAKVFASRGRPVRLIYLPYLHEETLGALMMTHLLETLVLSYLLGSPIDFSVRQDELSQVTLEGLQRA